VEKDYFVRPYRPGDEEKIVQFLQLVFDGWPHFDVKCNPLEHWRWKFEDNPLKPIIISLGTSDDKIIGCIHRIPRRIKIEDSVFLCCSGADVAVHPNFRKMGVFKKMDELAKKSEVKSGIKIFYGISSNPIMIKYYSNYRHIFPQGTFAFVRIKDVDRHLQMVHIRNANLYKYGFHVLRNLNKFRNTISLAHVLSGPSDQDFRILDIRSFDESINTFWDEIKDHYGFIVERSKDYLNWRYCDSRGGDYLIKIAERDGRILGYIVLRVNKYRRDYPIGYIVDLLTLPDRLDVVSALVRDAIHNFDDQNINITKCQIVKNHPYERIFMRYGFLNSRHRIHIFCIPHAPLGEELREYQKSSAKGLHFAYGDYDDI